MSSFQQPIPPSKTATASCPSQRSSHHRRDAKAPPANQCQGEYARDEAEAVTLFLTDTLAAVDPEKQGIDVTLREVLDGAAKRISEEFADRPLIQARLHYAVGWTYLGLGLLDEAQAHLADAAALYHRLKGKRHPDTLGATNALGVVFKARGNYGAAEARLVATLEISRRLMGEEHPATLAVTNNLAGSYYKHARYAEAEPLAARAVASAQGILSPKHDFLALYRRTHGQVLLKLGRLEEAERLLLDSYPVLSGVGSTRNEAGEVAQALIDLYEARHAAEPGMGYDTKAAEWRAKLSAEHGE